MVLWVALMAVLRLAIAVLSTKKVAPRYGRNRGDDRPRDARPARIDANAAATVLLAAAALAFQRADRP